MEVAIVIVIIIVILIVVVSRSNSSKTTNKETEQQRQAHLQSEQAERNRQAEILRQQQVDRERQVELQRQQAQSEQERRQAEQTRASEQQRFAEQQRLQAERQRQQQQTANYKTNWQNFQQVFQQNGITKLYHFTDRANLPSIRSNDGLYSWWEADRLGIEIPMPGGIGFGRDLDRRYGLENFVRICFTKQHPMLFIAKREGRIVNPIILEISLDVAYLNETRFCNMNATKNGHKQGKDLENLKSIRFDLVKQPNHFDISEAEKHFYQVSLRRSTPFLIS
jgi:flagellar biosynthesis GTPase FlhF